MADQARCTEQYRWSKKRNERWWPDTTANAVVQNRGGAGGHLRETAKGAEKMAQQAQRTEQYRPASEGWWPATTLFCVVQVEGGVRRSIAGKTAKGAEKMAQ